jgi:RNA polymerase sigma-70 factor (ECF subfamily)
MISFRRQVVALLPRLRRYSRALLRGDIEAAEDLVQDCVERALVKSHYWHRGTNLRAWLFTIMHNLHVNHVQRQANGPEFVEIDTETAAHPTAGSEQHVFLTDVQTALDELPPDQREIILLVALEGLRYQEVAQILGIPEGTVMSRLGRARQRMREQVLIGKGLHLKRVK